MAASLAQNDVVQGTNLGVDTRLFKKSVTFSAGTPAAALSATSIGTGLSGKLLGFRVQFGATAPNSLTVTITDVDGHTVATSGAITASGNVTLTGTPSFVGGLSVACSGNSTNNATALITLIYEALV